MRLRIRAVENLFGGIPPVKERGDLNEVCSDVVRLPLQRCAQNNFREAVQKSCKIRDFRAFIESGGDVLFSRFFNDRARSRMCILQIRARITFDGERSFTVENNIFARATFQYLEFNRPDGNILRKFLVICGTTFLGAPPRYIRKITNEGFPGHHVAGA